MKKTLCALVMGATTLFGCSSKPNKAPIINAQPPKDNTLLFVGEEFVYDMNVTDPEGDPLFFQAQIKSRLGESTVNFEAGRFRWTPNKDASYEIQVGAYDDKGNLRVVDGKSSAGTVQRFKVNVINKADYVDLSQHNLYIAKYIDNSELTWYEAHERAQKKGARLLTLREMVDFLYLLKTGNARDGTRSKLDSEKTNRIFRCVLGGMYGREQYEWVDASFEKETNTFHQYHKMIDGKLVPGASEILNKSRKKNGSIDVEEWLKNATSQGMPRSDEYPRTAEYTGFIAPENNNSVAKIGLRKANSGDFYSVLDCNADPRDPRNTGFRLVYEKK